MRKNVGKIYISNYINYIFLICEKIKTNLFFRKTLIMLIAKQMEMTKHILIS